VKVVEPASLQQVLRGGQDATPGTRTGPAILVGLIGRGIQASLSPRMHEAEGARLGFRYIYKLIDLDPLGLDVGALPDLVLAAERLGFTGLNITHPCKEAVLACLDELSPDAAAIGAVNTVVFAGGRRAGHNTDCWGFAEGFRRRMPHVALGRVLQLGAGGAGMAVARALLELGVGRLAIYDPDRAKAAALAAALCRQFSPGRAEAVEAAETAARQADGIVNASPVGMAKYPGSPLSPAVLQPSQWVADIIYFPAETEFLREARAKGCATMPGSGMAIHQAVKAFELFTGVAPDAEAMAREFAAA